MRLGKCVKINMIIAILLCMAFVVNFGATFALVNYSFSATSINTVIDDDIQYETYTEYANVQSASGNYVYSTGTVNNRLSIEYGFSQAHDLMVEFTATYLNDNHKANDFSLNIINRDNWCVDMQTKQGLASSGQEAQTYYSLTSSTNSISGVMYYMDTLNGSGTLPIISGVTFYTSTNNSYTYIGDNLNITLTPYYVKSNSSNYTASHTFASNLLNVGNQTAFTNWINYMSEETLSNSSYMIYNAYIDNSNSLAYPTDFNWATTGFDITAQTEPVYSNVAYRYALNKVEQVVNEKPEYYTTRTYSAVTAGNKYNGGLGVYVIPSETLKTIAITIDYHWQKNGQIEGALQNNMVRVEYSSDISKVTTTIIDDPETEDINEAVTYNTYYYRDEIAGPTYINVLDSIMLTAESGYMAVLEGGYSLVINNLTIIEQNSTPSGWTASDRDTYQVNNSSEQSPILVRIKDVATGSQNLATNVSVSNYGQNAMAIMSFKVKGKLWYGNYTDENHSLFTESIMGYLPTNSLTYDVNIWDATYDNDTYTFELKNDLAYIPVGYTMPLITGVTIPQQTDYDVFEDGKTSKLINDFWCLLEVFDIQTSTSITYDEGDYSGVEVVANGYYTTIVAGTTSSIYIRNNTNQNITSVSLSGLRLATFNTTNTTLLPRDNLNISTQFNYELTDCIINTTSIQSSISATSGTQTFILKPNEMVKLYTIKPTSNAVIYTYQISATLDNQVSADVELKFDVDMSNDEDKGTIVNNSDKFYEFRLESATKLADYSQTTPTSEYFISPSDFVEQKVDNIYYYYYKGVICANQTIEIFKDFVANISLNAIEHYAGADETYYVASNYTTWAPPTDWLSAMQKIYGEPSETDRDNAIVIMVE